MYRKEQEMIKKMRLRKPVLMSILCFLLSALFFVPGTSLRADESDSYSASAIEEAIREAIGVDPNDPLTWDMLTNLKTLMLSNKGVTDLSYLSMCPNLEELYIDGNGVKDLSALVTMKNLRILQAPWNELTDISALSGLTHLEELNLGGNYIRNIDAITGKTELKTLGLDGNPITDISPVGSCTALEYLSLSKVPLSDISSFAGLTSVKYLDMNYTGISDITPLENCMALEELFLEGNAITDVAPLSGLRHLKTLNLDGNDGIEDTSPLLWLSLHDYLGPEIVKTVEKPEEPSVEPADGPMIGTGVISSPVEARNGVVRILTIDDDENPASFATGSGFGVGIIGEETAIFLTNRHVVIDDKTGRIANHVYIMLDDSAVKQVYTSFGDFYDEELGMPFKLEIDLNHLVECEVLYPSDADPEFPDFAVIRAAKKIENRIAIPLLSTTEVEDASDVWTIGYPGSADKIYNINSSGSEMYYEANPEGAQLFTGTISRRGSLQSLGDTLALTHSAQIDHGNSGGPLVEENGRVIGINTYGFGSTGTSSVGYYLSIYIDYAMDKLNELGIPFNIPKEDATDEIRQALEGGHPDSQPAPTATPRPKPAEGHMTISLETGNADYTEDGELEDYYLRKYNEYGETTWFEQYDADGNLISRTEYVLNERGQSIRRQEYNSDGSKGKWSETVHDDEGRELEWHSYDENGIMDAWIDYVYDEYGTRSEKAFHFSTGNVEYTYYNGRGEPERVITADADGNLRGLEEYDSDGNMTCDIEYDAEGNISKQTQYEYDESGNEVFYLYQSGDYVSCETYTYNENGDRLTTVKYDGEGNVKSYLQYIYSEDGYECDEFDADEQFISATVETEDDFGKGTYQYDKDGNLTSSSVWYYDYDEDGFLTGKQYYRNGSLRSEYYYEVTDIKINPLEAEDYVDGGRETKRRTEP